MDEIPADARSTVRLTAGAPSEAEPALGAARPVESRERPFCIAVFADLTGRDLEGAAAPAAAAWSAVRATPDNMPELAGFRPSLPLRLGPGEEDVARLDLRGLDDFHPDVLFRGHPLFGELRDARRAVREGRDPGIELDAPPRAREPEEGEAEDDEPRRPDPRPDGRSTGDGGLLDEIVDRTSSGPGAGPDTPPDDDVLAFAREVVRPHLVPAGADRSADLAAVDRAASELMRRVVHAKAFRTAEGLWRALVFLLSRIDTTGEVRVYLVDVSRGELERDLAGTDDPADTRLGGVLTRPESADGPFRWALAVGAYAFGPEDAPLFRRIGRVARAADVPWVSQATPRLAGLDREGAPPGGRAAGGGGGAGWPGEWDALRDAPEARWLGLALPGFLVREPWGSELARPCRAFSFVEEPEEEEGGRAAPRRLPWGNPAFLVAAVLARAIAREGGAVGRSALDLEQAPMAPPRGDERAPSLTEIALRPSAAARLMDAGFMSVIGFPMEARLRVAGIRSISSGGTDLSAWWTGR